MQVTVFGASGKVGRLVVEDLLKTGYEVVAFVHNETSLTAQPKLRIINGDVHNSDDVERALKESQAVISTLGSWHTKTKDILSSAMCIIIPLMQKHHINRIISLTGSDALANGDKPNIPSKLLRPILIITAGKILYDGEKHIKMLEKSDLNWTVVRSPIMGNGEAHSPFKLDNIPPKPWNRVKRVNVAHAMCSLLHDTNFDKRCPFVH